MPAPRSSRAFNPIDILGKRRKRTLSRDPGSTRKACMTTRTGYLIDMDGVIYRGNQPIDGAIEFIQRLQEVDAPFLFLTNNSQRSRRDICLRLRRMGVDVREDQVFTCAVATARFLARQQADGSAYVIGEGGLLNA